MRISYYPGHAGESGQIFGGALGVAAGGDNFCVGIAGVDLADGVAGLGVGGCGDRAGVYDYHVGGVRVAAGSTAAVEELALNGGSIGLSCAAAELFDVESGRHLYE